MPAIFINYRRGDAAGYSGRLYDRLSRHFGKDRVFMDIDSIPIGDDFVQVIKQQLKSCKVVIALIGNNWLLLKSAEGCRRLDDPSDFVRLELNAAFAEGIQVVPVLVGAAKMPTAFDLPSDLSWLANLNAFEIYDRMFDESVTRLITIIDSFVTQDPGSWRPVLNALSRNRIAFTAASSILFILVISVVFWSKQAQENPRPINPAVDLDAMSMPPIESKFPRHISMLPPAVDAARTVLLRSDFHSVTGPRHPKLRWVSLLRSWVDTNPGSFCGAAEDGTLYFFDKEKHVFFAIRDGKEQWEYGIDGSLNFVAPAPDGRMWIGSGGQLFVFNSRGEGGLLTMKADPPYYEASNTEKRSSGIREYDGRWPRIGKTDKGMPFEYDGCQLGSFVGTDRILGADKRGRERQPKQWQVPLDGGKCGPATIRGDGTLLLTTDRGTMYAVNPEGQVQWTQQLGCKANFVAASDDGRAIYACGNTLRALDGGRPIWGLNLSLTSEDELANAAMGLDDPNDIYHVHAFDKLNTLYLETSYFSPHWLVAVNGNGQLLWKLALEHTSLLGLDRHGRLYLGGHSRILCFSD